MNFTEIIEYITNSESSAFFYTPKIYKNGKSILFKKPVESITAKNKNDLFKNLKTINSILDKGFAGYGFINYEAGYLLEEKLLPLFKESHEPILTFHFFEKKQIQYFDKNEIDYSDVKNILTKEEFLISNFYLNTHEDIYKKNIGKIRKYIKEGDTYQINYTVKGKFDFTGSIKSLFLNLIFNQSAEYSALINSSGNFIISISPELFFETNGKNIIAKPMKGTIKRGITNEDDKLKIETLSKSEKDKAENIMIVDLLRNDLGRRSEFNSVKVSSKFDIEKYESLFQMTSKVEAELKENNFDKITKNIFPCGSITGAPKIRTMEIINELESEPRGIYTGAIGIVEKDKYKFNVPIRTIKITKEGKGEIGIGSGVVWDSNAEDEYNETLLKSNFLTKPEKYFEIFESILIENGKPFLLEEHLRRMNEAADYFLFNYDYENIKNRIMVEAGKLDSSKNYKMKVELDKWGEIRIQNTELDCRQASFRIQKENLRIAVSDKRINSQNKFQYVKTTNRKLYDEELEKYKELGFYEVIFLNEKDEIAEGSFTNIFIKRDDEWLTPPLTSGILNGVYRKHLLQKNINSRECVLSLKDLKNSESVIIINSVRKEIFADEIYYQNKPLKKYKHPGENK